MMAARGSLGPDQHQSEGDPPLVALLGADARSRRHITLELEDLGLRVLANSGPNGRRPELVIVDLDGAGGRPASAIRSARKRWPEATLFALGSSSTQRPVAQAAGAEAFIQRRGPEEYLPHAIKHALDPEHAGICFDH